MVVFKTVVDSYAEMLRVVREKKLLSSLGVIMDNIRRTRTG